MISLQVIFVCTVKQLLEIVKIVEADDCTEARHTTSGWCVQHS